MNISKAKNEMSLNTGELEVLKKRTVSERVKPLSISGMDVTALKAKAEELWKQIIQVETSKYDLEERHKRQEYDLRELNERQRQINTKKYAAAGLEAETGRYPPKVQIISKHERRTDRRTFSDRRCLYDTSNRTEEQKELNKPAAKKRDTWIKEKKPEERQRYSYSDDLDEEPENTGDQDQENTFNRKSSSGGGGGHQEEVEAEAEEEEE